MSSQSVQHCNKIQHKLHCICRDLLTHCSSAEMWLCLTAALLLRFTSWSTLCGLQKIDHRPLTQEMNVLSNLQSSPKVLEVKMFWTDLRKAEREPPELTMSIQYIWKGLHVVTKNSVHVSVDFYKCPKRSKKSSYRRYFICLV